MEKTYVSIMFCPESGFLGGHFEIWPLFTQVTEGNHPYSRSVHKTGLETIFQMLLLKNASSSLFFENLL